MFPLPRPRTLWNDMRHRLLSGPQVDRDIISCLIVVLLLVPYWLTTGLAVALLWLQSCVDAPAACKDSAGREMRLAPD